MPGSVRSGSPATAPTSRPSKLRRGARGVLTDHWLLVAVAVYVVYACFVTWPLVTDLSGYISAPGVSGDLGGSIGHTDDVVDRGLFPFAPTTLPDFNAPYGADEPWVLNWASAPGTAMLYALSFVFGAVAGHGLFLLLGYVLSGTAMFLLARRLFGSVPAALLSGFVFAFNPFAIAKAEAHTHFVHGWVLVLVAWRALELAQAPTRRNGLLVGAAATLAMWFTPYFILFAGVAFATLTVVALVTCAARGELRAAIRAAAWSAVPPIVVFGAVGVLSKLGSGTGASGEGIRTQPLEALYTYAARVQEYLVPDRDNLLFGDRTTRYFDARMHGTNPSENSLYLGWSVLVIAAVGLALALLVVWRRRRAAAQDPQAVAAIAGGVVAAVAVAFSAPPKLVVLGHLVPMPSLLVFHVTSTWRVYSRFVVVVELGLVLAFAYGVARLLARRPAAARVAIAVALGAVLVVDLWARPDVRAIPTTPPDAYIWLKAHPGGTVAELPLKPAVAPDYSPLFWRLAHDHPIAQGYLEGSEGESQKLELDDPLDRDTAPDLAALGVRYVTVRAGIFPPEVDLAKHGFRLRLSRPDISVWEVVAKPSRARVDALTGFSTTEGPPNGQWRWAGTERPVLGVFASGCATCRGEVRFTSSSTDVPRRLTIRDEATSRVLTRVRVPAGPAVAHVRVPVALRDGKARLVLTTDPGPRKPASGDVRTLSVFVMEPHVRLDR